MTRAIQTAMNLNAPVIGMIPQHLSKILLVKAFEESDPQGRFLPLSTRHHATQQARADHPAFETKSPQTSLAFLTKRTEAIWAFLNQAYPSLTQCWSRSMPQVPAWMVAVPALMVGLLINGLGASQRVNLLNFPLLLLLVWNILIYLGTALLQAFPGSLARNWLDLPAQGISTFTSRWEPPVEPHPKGLDSSTVRWMQEATQRFVSAGWQETRHLWIQRLRQGLHLGAACMALGIVLGLYIRGLALDYQATWESTFLSASQVHSLLQVLLGPAAWLLHYPFPTLSDLALLQAPQHGPAAMWIHLWAVTSLAVIVVPRSLMAWLGQRSLKHALDNFSLPLHEPYYMHLLAPDRGQGQHVIILPYSYQPSPKTTAFLEKCFLDLFGNLSTLHWQPPVPFGQNMPTWPQPTTPTQTVVVIFNAGQTPEWEVQGEWLHLLQTERPGMASGSRLLMILDEEPYRQTVDQTRLDERRQTWQRLAQQYHLTLVPLDVLHTTLDQFLQQAHAGLWPAQQGEFP